MSFSERPFHLLVLAPWLATSALQLVNNDDGIAFDNNISGNFLSSGGSFLSKIA